MHRKHSLNDRLTRFALAAAVAGVLPLAGCAREQTGVIQNDTEHTVRAVVAYEGNRQHYFVRLPGSGAADAVLPPGASHSFSSANADRTDLRWKGLGWYVFIEDRSSGPWRWSTFHHAMSGHDFDADGPIHLTVYQGDDGLQVTTSKGIPLRHSDTAPREASGEHGPFLATAPAKLLLGPRSDRSASPEKP